MTPALTAIFALTTLGLVLGPLLARLAVHRTFVQPLALADASERRLLVAVAAEPHLTGVAHEATALTGEHFAHPGRAAAWDAIATAFAAGNSDPVAAALIALGAEESACEQLEIAVSGVNVDGPLDDNDAARVVLDAEDRTLYPSSAPVDVTGSDPPLARRHVQPSRTRQIRGAVFVGAGFGASAWLVPGAGMAAAWATIALCLCIATGYVLSEVDHDTFLIDHGTFFVGGALAWAAAVASALTGNQGANLVAGIVVAVGWAVGFEALNKAYKLLRGFDGMGAGDTLIVLMTAGVPTVISGSLFVGMYSVIAGAVLMLLVSVPKLVVGDRHLQTRLAMGPFLAAGWVVCWVALRILGVA